MSICPHCIIATLGALGTAMWTGRHLLGRIVGVCPRTERKETPQETPCALCKHPISAHRLKCPVPGCDCFGGADFGTIEAALLGCSDEDCVEEPRVNVPESDVHTRHCCAECGCKYGEDMTCTVARGWKKAEFRCEYCAYRERECRMCS